MLTSKQRSYLRGLANPLDSIFQIGKGGVGPNLIKQLDDALEARELIKVKVLQNAEDDTRDIFNHIAKELGAEEVQLIGSILVLYRKSSENPKIKLPQA